MHGRMCCLDCLSKYMSLVHVQCIDNSKRTMSKSFDLLNLFMAIMTSIDALLCHSGRISLSFIRLCPVNPLAGTCAYHHATLDHVGSCNLCI